MTVLHIPHASSRIPADVRAQFALDDQELEAELARMTDWFTDELFGGAVPGGVEVVYPFSRLVVDPERFPADEDEPASQVGMGAVYTHTSDGRRLRRGLPDGVRAELLRRYYDPHHGALARAVDESLVREGKCLIIDCHSFPMRSIPFELSSRRPEICIGTDKYHTPLHLAQLAAQAFQDNGFTVAIDDPFAGALVPQAYYGTDARVAGLMVEVGRWVYMDEDAVEKSAGFEAVRTRVGDALRLIHSEFWGTK